MKKLKRLLPAALLVLVAVAVLALGTGCDTSDRLDYGDNYYLHRGYGGYRYGGYGYYRPYRRSYYGASGYIGRYCY